MKKTAATPPARPLEGCQAIEGYLDRLNQASPVAERRIVSAGRGSQEFLRLSALPLTDGSGGVPTLLAECELGFALELQTRCASAAPRGHVVGLVMAGAMTVWTSGGQVELQAGEGVILDPREVDRSRLASGTRFVEFTLAGAQTARLCGQWAPGLQGELPSFSPRLAPGLAQKLAFMAAQAAAAQPVASAGRAALPLATGELARRWSEMIVLTLLDEQPLQGASAPQQAASLHGPAPASVRRALDFMHAHADSAIGLADIAAAACTSPRSLLRHFQAHLGTTPAAFLRGIRLERARRDLQADGAGTVRDIALRWGFQNASKFSKAYHSRYGHTPSRERGLR